MNMQDKEFNARKIRKTFFYCVAVTLTVNLSLTTFLLQHHVKQRSTVIGMIDSRHE